MKALFGSARTKGIFDYNNDMDLMEEQKKEEAELNTLINAHLKTPSGNNTIRNKSEKSFVQAIQQIETFSTIEDTDVYYRVSDDLEEVDLCVSLVQSETWKETEIFYDPYKPLTSKYIYRRKKSQTKIRQEYARYAHSLGFRIVGEAFYNLQCNVVSLSVYCMGINPVDGNPVREYLYSVRVTQNQWQQVNFNNIHVIDPIEVLGIFDMNRKMTKTCAFKAVVPEIILDNSNSKSVPPQWLGRLSAKDVAFCIEHLPKASAVTTYQPPTPVEAVKFFPSGFDVKLSNAIKSMKIPSEEALFALVDATSSGTNKDGVAFGKLALHGKRVFRDNVSLNWDSFMHSTITIKDKQYIDISGAVLCFSNIDIEIIYNTLITIQQYLLNKYQIHVNDTVTDLSSADEDHKITTAKQESSKNLIKRWNDLFNK